MTWYRESAVKRTDFVLNLWVSVRVSWGAHVLRSWNRGDLCSVSSQYVDKLSPRDFLLISQLDRSLGRARVPGFVFNRNNIQEKTTFIKKSIHPNQMSTLVLLRLVSSVKFVGEHSSQLPFQKWWIYGNWELWAPLVFTTMTKHQTVDEHHGPYHHFTFLHIQLGNFERVIWPREPCSY